MSFNNMGDLYPLPGNPSDPPTWEDIERLALHYPQVRSAVVLVARGDWTREQALIVIVFSLADSFSRPMTTPTPQELLALADRLDEGLTVLDEPFHRTALESVMSEASAILRALTAAPSAGAGAQEVKACPCLHTTPCDPDCTCVNPLMSRGCARCCSYGSPEQQKAMAEHLAALASPPPPPPDTLDREALTARMRELEETCLSEIVAAESDTQARAWAERAECVAAALACLRAPTPTGE